MRKRIWIAGKQFSIGGDDSYVRSIGDTFEPELMAIMASMCEPGAQVLDVGANVGMTALGFSHVNNGAKVVAVEPVPRTFALLKENTRQASNVVALNFALGKTPGKVTMQGHNDNLSGSFVSDTFHISENNHFSVDVEVKTVDQCFDELGLDRIDFLKIDVEGFELEVLEGAIETINRFKPRVVLEMNHWCLNMFRRISLPEFRDRLMTIFPVLYALDGEQYLDITDEENFRVVGYTHLTAMRYANIVAGFDAEDLERRMDSAIRSFPKSAHAAASTAEIPDTAGDDVGELKKLVADLKQRLAVAIGEHDEVKQLNHKILESTSWKITAPMRALKRFVG